jgi:F-type H+-transporting ATPase subunit b
MSRFSLRTGLRGLALLSLSVILLAASNSVMLAQDASQPEHHAAAPGGDRTAPDSTAPAEKEEIKDANEAYRQSPTVRKFGAMLGMKPVQAATAFEVFNFVVLAILVGYGLIKALPKTFRNRSSAIQKKLADARTATEEAKARLNSVEARLSKLDSQIAEMRTHAEQDSIRDEKRIKASVEDEKAKILAAAEAEIQAATTLAQRQIQQYAAELAIEQAARKLVVTAETDRLLVESFAHRLGADKGDQN